MCVSDNQFQSSRTQHPGDVENLFRLILEQIRNYTVVFAVQKSHEQMGRAMFYRVDRQPMPTDPGRTVFFPNQIAMATMY
jgi:hypothetical protein